ncbi:bifunctional transcriptional activator/DNA repair enzyme AdaA [Oceanobacillus locisalsi]|uniref:Bifunctional transcriptional activator/DNA repair enzyme AdaA n=1 Tax=Oceanobacillus locisalsi TaxID=546107 RepID=A0ABW3NDJ3_9BACI
MNIEQWIAVRDNDKTYDSSFYYALTTTKTVCRPSCTARTPNPEHVIIYKNLDAAIKEGFRPCNRCKPDKADWEGYKEEVAKRAAIYMEEHYHESITLQVLSEVLQKNPFYIQRCFKAVKGISPLTYVHQLRIEKAKQLLVSTNSTVTEAALQAGYNDSTHFSVKFKEFTGVSPTTFRQHAIE